MEYNFTWEIKIEICWYLHLGKRIESVEYLLSFIYFIKIIKDFLKEKETLIWKKETLINVLIIGK